MGHRLQQFLPFTQPLRPHLFRHQMLTYLTSKGLTDAQIQLISGHESKKNLDIVSGRRIGQKLFCVNGRCRLGEVARCKAHR